MGMCLREVASAGFRSEGSQRKEGITPPARLQAHHCLATRSSPGAEERPFDRARTHDKLSDKNKTLLPNMLLSRKACLMA